MITASLVDTYRARDRKRDRKTTTFELLMFRQLASWQDQFDRMDLNHDGVLQRSEYDRGMQAQSDMCEIVSYIQKQQPDAARTYKKKDKRVGT